MAKSPAHRFGQMIGEVIELAVECVLSDFARRHDLYLDKKGSRPARRGKKLTWIDNYGNKHDLDFVLERNGSPQQLGLPVAFIEVAWRRYTKHSRNKAQEIQGAIIPLRDANRNFCPLIGVVTAGEFTSDALKQLRSVGFHVAYFPYETVIGAFKAVSIDARWEENTSEAELEGRFRLWEALQPSERLMVGSELVRLNSQQLQELNDALHSVASRFIKTVRILPLHGQFVEWQNIEDAIAFIQSYKENRSAEEFVRYEVQVLYSNGDKIVGEFAAKNAAVDFLLLYSTSEK